MPVTAPDPQLVADAEAYRALCALAQQWVEVTVQQFDAMDDEPAKWKLIIVGHGMEFGYEGATLAEALDAERRARTERT